MDNLNKLLSKNLKKIRTEKGLTQDYMAHMLDISQPSYSDIENNKVKFPLDKIDQILVALDATIDQLFDGFNKKTPEFDDEHALPNWSTLIKEVENIKHCYNNQLDSKNKEIEALNKRIQELLKQLNQ